MYKGTNSSTAQLLEKNFHNSSVKHAVEFYKVKHKIAAKLIRDLF